MHQSVPGKKRRGRQKHGGMTHVKDYRNVGVNRTKRKNDIDNHSGDPRRWEKPEKKKTRPYLIAVLQATLALVV